jgi:hypothetical protein
MLLNALPHPELFSHPVPWEAPLSSLQKEDWLIFTRPFYFLANTSLAAYGAPSPIKPDVWNDCELDFLPEDKIRPNKDRMKVGQVQTYKSSEGNFVSQFSLQDCSRLRRVKCTNRDGTEPKVSDLLVAMTKAGAQILPPGENPNQSPITLHYGVTARSVADRLPMVYGPGMFGTIVPGGMGGGMYPNMNGQWLPLPGPVPVTPLSTGPQSGAGQ